MNGRRRASLAIAALVTVATVGGLVAWSFVSGARHESQIAVGAVSASSTELPSAGEGDERGSAAADAGVSPLATDVPPEWDTERLRSELGSASELLETRQRMVDRGAELRLELERNGARRQVREQLVERTSAATRRRDEALTRVRALSARLADLGVDGGVPAPY